MFCNRLNGKRQNISFYSKISPLAIFSFLLFGILSSIAYCYTEEDFKEELLNAKPIVVETGEFNGSVIDAVTGKPVEGAVVVYRWDTNVALYDTITDKDGKYFIPNQSIEWEPFSRPEHEEVIIYKFGYLWYCVDEEGQASFFMRYVPDLTPRYKKKNNIVRLQPWIDELSHSEHLYIFERYWDYPKVPFLEEALLGERALADRSKKLEEEKAREAEKKISKLNTANEKNNAFSPRPGSGIMALGGRRVSPKNVRKDEERKIQEERRRVNKLCADYKKGNIPEREYKQRLHGYLETTDHVVLGKTVEALKELNDYSGIPVLIEYLKENIYRERNFSGTLYSFRKITGRTDLPEGTNVIPERIEIVQDVEQWWQRNKDQSESQWRHDLVTNGRTHSARLQAMREIRKNKDKSALPAVLQCLKSSEDSLLYERAILTLSEIGDQKVVPDIKKKLYHENVYVRRQAALTLNKFGDKIGVPVMVASLDSPSENTRSVANAVLREITGQDFNHSKDIKSLRQLSAEQQEAVIQRWKQWWQDNKKSFASYHVNDISDILKADDEVLNKRHLEIIAAAQKKPEAPVFNDPKDSPEFCFEQFKTALGNGEIDEAVSFLLPHIRNERKELFEQIGPEGCRHFAKGMGPILFDNRLEERFQYEMITETDEGVFLFPVNFIRIDEGEWIIQGF